MHFYGAIVLFTLWYLYICRYIPHSWWKPASPCCWHYLWRSRGCSPGESCSPPGPSQLCPSAPWLSGGSVYPLQPEWRWWEPSSSCWSSKSSALSSLSWCGSHSRTSGRGIGLWAPPWASPSQPWQRGWCTTGPEPCPEKPWKNDPRSLKFFTYGLLLNNYTEKLMTNVLNFWIFLLFI